MDEERLSQLYNLIINPGTRDWERSQLLAARDRLESGQEQKMSYQSWKLLCDHWHFEAT